MSKITIEFENSEYGGNFFEELKKSISIATYKPKNIRMSMEDEV